MTISLVPVPGRICPKSDSPVVECVATCRTSDCYVLNEPDSLFAEKLELRGRPQAYISLSLPSSFETASLFSMETAIRDRLSLITPETEQGVAVMYLKDASLMLFMGRALQGILKSESKDMIPYYEDLLKSKIDEGRKTRLEEFIADLRKTPPEKGSVEVQAQRMKSAFSLFMASKLQEST